MGSINIHNYEAYLLDLSEGNLAEELQMELELFLVQHPELGVDLEDMACMSLTEETVLFSDKSILKKTITDLVPEEQFIAYIENQLPEKERAALEKSCGTNKDLAKELALYSKTIIAADTEIVYSHKHDLKRKPKVIWFNFSAAQFAAAASVVLILGLYVLWPTTETTNYNTTTLAQNKSNKQTTNINAQQTLPVKINTGNVSTQTQMQNTSSVHITPKQLVAVTANTNSFVNSPNQEPEPDINDMPSALTNLEQHLQPVKEEKRELLAMKQKTIVEVITESDDEQPLADNANSKKGFWSKAGKVLRNLNAAGVKSVDGDEKDTKENTAYALTLGNINITHKAGL